MTTGKIFGAMQNLQGAEHTDRSCTVKMLVIACSGEDIFWTYCFFISYIYLSNIVQISVTWCDGWGHLLFSNK